MIPNFDARKGSGHLSPDKTQESREMDILLRDRSELLSAYIDGEVTAAERKQVQQWLNTDSQMQCLYARLVKLRQGIQTLPVPQSEQPAKHVARQVFARISGRSTARNIAWGGAAIAALFVGTLSNVFPGSQSPVPHMAAIKSTQPEVAPKPLMVALNRPLVDIPKAAVSYPQKSVTPGLNKINKE